MQRDPKFRPGRAERRRAGCERMMRVGVAFAPADLVQDFRDTHAGRRPGGSGTRTGLWTFMHSRLCRGLNSSRPLVFTPTIQVSIIMIRNLPSSLVSGCSLNDADAFRHSGCSEFRRKNEEIRPPGIRNSTPGKTAGFPSESITRGHRPNSISLPGVVRGSLFP